MEKEKDDWDFWNEYYNAEYLDKEKKLKNIVENIERIADYKDEGGETRRRILLMQLKSYFDDLISYMLTKK